MEGSFTLAVILLVVALALATALVARPSTVDEGEEKASSRDIVLCLDVSGSALPYDREVIDTYRQLVDSFKGERIGLSIFNSTSRTVFPLTDDYELVSKQLDKASSILAGVESQDDIDKMKDSDYQAISDWLEGTQNRKESTSLIGDGVVSCAAMLPGFAYGNASADNAERQRAASIVLATDNVVSGKPTYTLDEALNLTKQAQITWMDCFPDRSRARPTRPPRNSNPPSKLIMGCFSPNRMEHPSLRWSRKSNLGGTMKTSRATRPPWWMLPDGGHWPWPSF